MTIALVAGVGVSAHRLDEYLQAARVDLHPDGVRIELDLTPGAAVAESIILLIDRDRDGSASAGEQHAYAGDVVKALAIAVDGKPLPVRLESVTVPAISAFRRGEGTLRLRISASHPALSPGRHELFFSNRHLAAQSVYLANALVPESARVSVTGQRRDDRQSELTIDYAIAGRAASFASTWVLVGLAATVLLVRYARRRRATSLPT